MRVGFPGRCPAEPARTTCRPPVSMEGNLESTVSDVGPRRVRVPHPGEGTSGHRDDAETSRPEGRDEGPHGPPRPATTLVGLPRTSAEKRPTQSASLAWDARVCRAQSSDGSRADVLVSGPRRDPAPARSACPAPGMDGWTRGARRILTARLRSSPALSPPWLLLLLMMALKPTVSLRSDDNNFRFSSESLFSKASRPSTWRVIALLCLTR